MPIVRRSALLALLQAGPLNIRSLPISYSSTTSMISRLRKDGHDIVLGGKGIYELRAPEVPAEVPVERQERPARRPTILPHLGQRVKITGLRLLGNGKVVIMVQEPGGPGWEATLHDVPTWAEEAP